MDAKGRMAMPTRLREPLHAQCEGKIVVTIDNRSSCLVMFPLPEWEVLAAEIQALPSIKPAVRRFQRLILGYATDLELDGNGRILLPPSLREHARLEKKVKLVGLGNKLELWSEELWMGECDLALKDALSEEDIPDELMSLTTF
jgi:MraZ protein